MLTRLLFVLFLVVPAARVSAEDDDATLKARAALALAAERAPGKCQCAAGRTLTLDDAMAKGKVEGLPVVVFGGCAPRCCGDALPVRLTLAQSGARPERPIVVYAPTKDGWRVAAELPADATQAEVKEAVEKAKRMAAEK
jgi:hypothetical protein